MIHILGVRRHAVNVQSDAKKMRRFKGIEFPGPHANKEG